MQADTVVQSAGKDPTPYLPLVVSYANPRILEQCNQIQRARLQGDTQERSAPAASDPQSLNRYTYTLNNPLSYVDPGGNVAWFVAPLVGGALIGGLTSLGTYLATSAITHHEVTLSEAAGSFASGAVAGMVSVFATPLAGTLVKGLRMAAGNTTLAIGNAVINAAGGATAYLAGGYTENLVNAAMGKEATFKPSARDLLANAGVAGVSAAVLASAFPVRTDVMRTLRQAEYFMPGRRTVTILESFYKPAMKNATNLYWRQTWISAGIGGLAGTAQEPY
ncbi:MAG: hypothetical protein Kow00123_16420 [Anaerolineales bacterium]